MRLINITQISWWALVKVLSTCMTVFGFMTICFYFLLTTAYVPPGLAEVSLMSAIKFGGFTLFMILVISAIGGIIFGIFGAVMGTALHWPLNWLLDKFNGVRIRVNFFEEYPNN